MPYLFRVIGVYPVSRGDVLQGSATYTSGRLTTAFFTLHKLGLISIEPSAMLALRLLTAGKYIVSQHQIVG